jgi:hypothetical protein
LPDFQVENNGPLAAISGAVEGAHFLFYAIQSGF